MIFYECVGSYITVQGHMPIHQLEFKRVDDGSVSDASSYKTSVGALSSLAGDSPDNIISMMEEDPSKFQEINLSLPLFCCPISIPGEFIYVSKDGGIFSERNYNVSIPAGLPS